jgi:hypothetical protein
MAVGAVLGSTDHTHARVGALYHFTTFHCFMTVTKLYLCNTVGLTGFYTPVNLYFLDKAVLWFHVQMSLIH